MPKSTQPKSTQMRDVIEVSKIVNMKYLQEKTGRRPKRRYGNNNQGAKSTETDFLSGYEPMEVSASRF